MRNFVLHDSEGKVKSFGVASDAPNVRVGMHAAEGTTLSVVDSHIGEVDNLRRKRGKLADKLSIDRSNPKATRLKIS